MDLFSFRFGWCGGGKERFGLGWGDIFVGEFRVFCGGRFVRSGRSGNILCRVWLGIRVFGR